MLAWSELRGGHNAAASRSRRILAVVLGLLFLFPCVSESDDLLALQNLQFTLETSGETGSPLPQKSDDEKPGLHLARFFASLESLEVASLYAILLTLLCFAFVVSARTSAWERSLVTACGRAPPRIPIL